MTHGAGRAGVGVSLAAFGVALTATVAMDFRLGLTSLALGIDDAYCFSYNRATAEGLRWGRDFVSTYGPYGYFIMANDLGSLAERRVVFEAARAVAAALAVVVFVAKLPGAPWIRIGWAILLTWALALQTPEYRLLGPVLIGLVAAVPMTGRAAIPTLALCASGAGLLLLVKASVGGAAVLAALVGAALRGDRLRRLAACIGGALVGLAGGWLAHHGTLAGLANHLALMRQIGSGYSSAMSLDHGSATKIACFFGYIALMLLGAWLARSRDVWLTLGVTALPLFALWKHGFVRQDVLHTPAVLWLGLLVALLLFAQAAAGPRRLGACVLALAPLSLTPLLVGEPMDRTVLSLFGRQLRAPWSAPGLADLGTLRRLELHRHRLGRRSRHSLAAGVQPARLESLVGSAGIDAYPLALAIVAANPNLNWTARPSPASFGSYTPVLDALNVDFLESPSRPQFVLWAPRRVTDIDMRHAFWNEPLTLRTLVDRYDFVDGELLLLRARALPRFAGERELGRQSVAWGEWIAPPRTPRPLLMRVGFGRSPLRILTRVLFRENPAHVELRLASGQVEGFRFVPDNAGSGLWIDPLPLTLDGLPAAWRGERRRDPIAALRFLGPWSLRRTGALTLTWVELLPAAASLRAPVGRPGAAPGVER